jgi:N-acetylglucosamine malate deacetylase 2
LLRLLCVTAHPDDEALGFGGALLRYSMQGVETHVICMTPGQAATHRGPAKSDQELAALRRLEFQSSCELLRVAHGEVLDFPDGGLDKVDFRSAVEELTGRIRRIRPQVVMTMGLEGGLTAHPDHSMVSLFTTLAFHWAGRAKRFPEQLKDGVAPHRAQKLYYGTAAFTVPHLQPVALAPASVVMDVREHLEVKIAAFKRHATQSPLFVAFEKTVRQQGGWERFLLAAATTPRQVEMETDLFVGVSEGSV